MFKNKQSFKILLITFALIALFISIIPMQVNAVTFTCPSCGNSHTLDWMQKIDFDFTNEVFSGQLFAKGDMDATGLDVNSVLAFDTSVDGSVFNNLWDYVGEVYEAMRPLGEILAVIYFLLALMEKAMQDQFNAEQLARSLVRLFAMIIMVRNGFAFCTWGMELSTFMYKKLQELSDFKGNPKACKYQACKDRGFFESIANILSMIFPYLLMSIAKLIIRVICWTRVLNLCIRVMFAPIGMADSIKGGTSSQGFKYLKKIISCAVQGTVILGVSVGYNLVCDAITTNGGGTAWLHTIILAAVMVTLVFKANKMADDILGC